MDSQSVMLETATAGSSSSNSSSDSFCQISRSGASSSSNSLSTRSSHSTIDRLKEECDRLHEEKTALEGRLRGFKTLNNLLLEKTRENEDLKCLVKTLQSKQRAEMYNNSDDRFTVSSPFSLVSMQAAQDMKNEGLLEPEMVKLSLTEQNRNLPPSLGGTLNAANAVHSQKPVAGESMSSLQETSGPPADEDETQLISYPLADDRLKLGNVHKQESLGNDNGGAQRISDETTPFTSFSKADIEMVKGPPEPLQPDSDRYDDETYEKLAPQLGQTGMDMTSSMYAAGGAVVRQPATGTREFPSLSSEASNGFSQAGSLSNVSNPPRVTDTQHSLMGQSSSSHGQGLAAEVETITEYLSSLTGDSTSAIANQMHQIAEQISKMEQKKEDQKKLVGVLMRENLELKRQLKAADSIHLTETLAMREQNTRLMQQLKSRQLTQDVVNTKRQTPDDWVYLEKPGKDHALTEQSLVDRVRKLEQEKAELQRANTNWKTQWDKMEQQQQIKVSELQSKLVLSDGELSKCKTRLAEVNRDIEAHMLEMKKRIGEEENLKEEALHQQTLAERRCSELQESMAEVRNQLSDTAREKQSLAAELNTIKAQISPLQMQTNIASSSSPGLDVALQVEIVMLKEQLKVFAEDFEHERQDRTAAQSARDVAKKNAEFMARHNMTQIKQLHNKIKEQDDTISWTLRQNETLQHQITEYKKRVASFSEEKQSLQRMLAMMKQQIQQQQQQALRSVYQSHPQQHPVPAGFLAQETSPAVPTAPSHLRPGGAAVQPTLIYSGQSALYPLNASVVSSPELLPGAWDCSKCTYINFPGRTVCESCGTVNNSPRSHPDAVRRYPSQDTLYGSEHALLMSRGADQTDSGDMSGNSDLVVESAPLPCLPIRK